MREGWVERYHYPHWTDFVSDSMFVGAWVCSHLHLRGSSEAGAWARSEYIPILLRSCLAIGQVPSDLAVSLLRVPMTHLTLCRL